MLSGKVYKCIVDLRYFLVLSLLVMMNVCVVYKSVPQHLCGCQWTSFAVGSLLPLCSSHIIEADSSVSHNTDSVALAAVGGPSTW